MPTSPAPRMRPWIVPAVVLLALACAGCDDGIGACHPVEGRVLLKGKPLQGMAGSVLFVPDQAKGNAGPLTPTGKIAADGKFTLMTRGKPGAPPGWYKAVVAAVPPGIDDREVVRRPLIHRRFTGAKTTPLAVEVVAEPPAGGYDLKVASN